VSKIEKFGQTQNVSVTVLVDNRADLIVKSTDTVKRFTDQPLLAEHGFAALVELKDIGVRILWDAGMTQAALLENARRMEIDLSTVDAIALSHGHGDHTAAMTDAIRAVGAFPEGREWEAEATMDEILEWTHVRRVPLVAHPAAFRERWAIRKDGTKYGPVQPAPRSSSPKGRTGSPQDAGRRARCRAAVSRARGRPPRVPTARAIGSYQTA
jgi:metal-dependent hydrolase (beta-lactamase superfamily II)